MKWKLSQKLSATREWSPLPRVAAEEIEFELPKVLRASYSEWDYESLDGLLEGKMQLLGNGRVEVFAVAILISNQTLTPVRLVIAADHQSVASAAIGLVGGFGPLGISVGPYGHAKTLFALNAHDQARNWAYSVNLEGADHS